MATLLSRAVEAIETSYSSVKARAVDIAKNLLAPSSPVPKTVLEKLFHRSLRNGSWRAMSRELRALILAALSSEIHVFKSPKIIELFRVAWLFVETFTARGRAVIAALVYMLARKMPIEAYLRRGLSFILSLGIQVLNTPYTNFSFPAEL